MLVKALYTDRSDIKGFESKVIGETVQWGEPAYILMLLPKWQPLFENGDKPWVLRKSMVDGKHLYKAIEEPKFVQMSLFDL